MEQPTYILGEKMTAREMAEKIITGIDIGMDNLEFIESIINAFAEERVKEDLMVHCFCIAGGTNWSLRCSGCGGLVRTDLNPIKEAVSDQIEKDAKIAESCCIGPNYFIYQNVAMTIRSQPLCKDEKIESKTGDAISVAKPPSEFEKMAVAELRRQARAEALEVAAKIAEEFFANQYPDETSGKLIAQAIRAQLPKETK